MSMHGPCPVKSTAAKSAMHMQTHDVEVSIDGVQRVLCKTPGVKQ